MVTVESQGTIGTVFQTQLLPVTAMTSFPSVFHRFSIGTSEWKWEAGILGLSLLSSSPLTENQIKKGQEIARKYGLTE